MNFYVRNAEWATTERMRERWARLLAGEIGRPGTFSIGTLQFFASADDRSANLVAASLPKR